MPRPINMPQILIGGAVLAIGALVYLIDRLPDHTYFVSNTGMSLHNTLPNLFGPAGNVLPALAHVFSFILLTAGVLSCQKRGCLIICLIWFFVDCAFEFGQKFNIHISAAIPDWFGGIPVLENSAAYFLLGTFDYFDLVAIAVGSLLAYFIALGTMERRNVR